jgi:cardiolipin synthase
VGAALTERRVLGDTESGTLIGAAVLLAALAIVAIAWPAVVGWPIGLLAAWFAINTGIRAWHSAAAASAPHPRIDGTIDGSRTGKR